MWFKVFWRYSPSIMSRMAAFNLCRCLGIVHTELWKKYPCKPSLRIIGIILSVWMVVLLFACGQDFAKTFCKKKKNNGCHSMDFSEILKHLLFAIYCVSAFLYFIFIRQYELIEFHKDCSNCGLCHLLQMINECNVHV